MNVISVWVLVFYMGGYRAGGASVIDNITTVAECQRVAEVLMERNRTSARCIEVRKVKP